MEKSYNILSFYLIILCISLSAYSLYSNMTNAWLIAPPVYILLVISLIALILGILGCKDKRNWRTKTRSWVTVVLSSLTTIGLFAALMLTLFAASLGATEHMKTVHSPDGKYTIDFYSFDAGAAGTFGVRGELNGPLWFKKRIYYQPRAEQAKVEWINNSTVSINSKILHLNEGETYGY